MKHILIIFLLLQSFVAKAQIDSVIVEKYYISDANDAMDSTYGKLAPGSTTYRIYIDMVAGSRLTKLYGDANHALKIKSDSVFFNNTDRGKSFGYELTRTHLRENTVALDTWLTLGQVAKTYIDKQVKKTLFGVLKRDDKDTVSIIGGINNDEGLLVHEDAAAGKSLTMADGLTTMDSIPSNWANNGIIVSGEDSTIFGSNKLSTEFISYAASLQNSGVMGATPDNKVLVAQLTTNGKISFELNVEITDSKGNTMNYVANDSILEDKESLSSYLKYPFELKCGCPDKKYVEYKKDRDCSDITLCQTAIVLGCMDPNACNYNPDANFPLRETNKLSDLCCYPGYCNDRDLSLVCPSINQPQTSALEFSIYPNPVEGQLSIEITSPEEEETTYSIHDSYGNELIKQNLGAVSNTVIKDIDVSHLPQGLYLLRVSRAGASTSKRFMKK